MKKQRIAPGTPIDMRMSEADRDLIIAATFMDSEFMERLVPLVGKPDQLTGKFTLDDLEDMLGHIAASANHAGDQKLESKLDAIYKRLSKLQSSYDDEG